MTAQDLSGFNARELGRLVREHRKREGLSLRAAADACGCPFNTLGRVEKGHLPDLANFARLARWAGFDPDVILGRTRVAQQGTSETIRAALHADPALDEAAADQIAGVLDSLYGTLARSPSTVAHVHAAQVMTPAASRMTANIVGDLDNPGDVHWWRGQGPAEVLGECPHDCEHRSQRTLAWGPDLTRYELARCDDVCAGTCRAWTDGGPGNTTPWMHVDVPAREPHSCSTCTPDAMSR